MSAWSLLMLLKIHMDSVCLLTFTEWRDHRLDPETLSSSALECFLTLVIFFFHFLKRCEDVSA